MNAFAIETPALFVISLFCLMLSYNLAKVILPVSSTIDILSVRCSSSLSAALTINLDILSILFLISVSELLTLLTAVIISAERALNVATNSAVFAMEASVCLAPILYIAESCLPLSATLGRLNVGLSVDFSSSSSPKSNPGSKSSSLELFFSASDSASSALL